MKLFYLIILTLIINSCYFVNNELNLDDTANDLVELTLKLGEKDPDLVDSYIGELIIDTNEEIDLIEVKRDIKSLKSRLIEKETSSEIDKFRKNYQLAMINALEYRLKILNDEKLNFLDECEGIYQYRPELKPYSYYDSLLSELNILIPGEGDLKSRFSKYREKFKVKNKNLDKSFEKALQFAANSTKQHIELPDSEKIEIEFISGAPWSAYNWYKGDYKSLIQVNKNVEIHFETILDLAAHESYPGHHVYYTKREQNFYKDSGFVEFSIYTLFSPVSFLAEGTAEYGIDLVFPDDEKIGFIKKNVIGAENFTKTELKKYFVALEIVEKLNEATVNVAKSYLDGEIIIEEAVSLLQKYGLESEKSAIRRMNFIRRYRSYVMNYTLGKRFVKNYIQNKAPNDIKSKWDVYRILIEKPYLPKDLIEDTADYSSI